MKRLSFFRVYGRVDPRLNEIRGGCTIMSNGGIRSMVNDCAALLQTPVDERLQNHMASMFRIARDSFGAHEGRRVTARQVQRDPTTEYMQDHPLVTMESVTLAANEVCGLMEAEANSAIRRMVEGCLARAVRVMQPPVETVEAIREREKQNFLCNQRNAKMMAQPTTQWKIDRMFGRHDPSGRKESLAHHAHAIRLKLEAKGMDTKEVEKFIASLSLEESAVNQKQTLP